MHKTVLTTLALTLLAGPALAKPHIATAVESATAQAYAKRLAGINCRYDVVAEHVSLSPRLSYHDMQQFRGKQYNDFVGALRSAHIRYQARYDNELVWAYSYGAGTRNAFMMTHYHPDGWDFYGCKY